MKDHAKLRNIGLQFFAEPGDPALDDPTPGSDPEPSPEDTAAELKKLQDELARQKAATDRAAKEAADYKKQLRASKSAEEQRAEEEKERQAAIEEELKTLRKQSAVATISKRVLTFVGDEAVSNTVADAMYGAEDVDAAIDAISKAWNDREKKLRLEYSKLPAPGGGENDPQVPKEDFNKMGYKERMEFRKKYPETYQKLTNR